jgi:phosphoglycerate dehydrogenase-like enzyme
MIIPRPVRRIAIVCAALCIVCSSSAYAEKIRILVSSYFAEELADLSETYPNLELVVASSREEVEFYVPSCEAVVGVWSSYAPALVAGIDNLRWIQSSSAGVEGFLREQGIADSDVVLTNAKIIQGPEIGDHAMALLLNLTRDIKGFNEKMAVGWNRSSRLPMIELRGKTMLILGLGGIGSQVAERAAAFGMRIVAVDPKDIPYWSAVSYIGKPDELDALIPEADVIVSCVPHTPATDKMLGAKQFELMKEESYVINISRGKIIDTDALVAALQSGKLAGAGLDVTDPEPLPPDHPLWQMPNVTITPHIAGASDQIGERRLQLFRDNIARYVQGLPLKNVVSKKAGF